MAVKHQNVLGLILVISFMMFFSCGQKEDEYRELIKNGKFSEAKEMIQNKLATDTTLTQQQKQELSFEIERMERIKKDFTKTEEEVFNYIKKYKPDVTKQDMRRWEKEKSLEYMMINGEKRYFNRAARNLFRINEKCREIWNEYHKKEKTEKAETEKKFDLNQHDREIINAALENDQKYVKPVRMWIRYSVSVHPDAVPEGETVRCWIPFPRKKPERQKDIIIIKTDPNEYKLADNSNLQRTIYFEKPAKKNEPTTFFVEYEYTGYGVYVNIDPEKVVQVDPEGELKPYLQERPPHIVFTDELKELSDSIVGDETNPYRIAQKLFEWVDVNIPWASAREYSTIRNISSYCYENMHGDCGIQTLLFMTLCRMNGIPTHWQSGWEFQPPDDSMHDWGMIYFEPYGWVPMDVTYGLRKMDDNQLKWFYLNGMDSYRLIFNDDYSQPFSPKKVHHRSETVDSQRGEVEWDGGNLYFDQWDWNMEWKVVSK